MRVCAMMLHVSIMFVGPKVVASIHMPSFWWYFHKNPMLYSEMKILDKILIDCTWYNLFAPFPGEGVVWNSQIWYSGRPIESWVVWFGTAALVCCSLCEDVVFREPFSKNMRCQGINGGYSSSWIIVCSFFLSCLCNNVVLCAASMSWLDYWYHVCFRN